jgi:hypothetical protein
MASRHRPSIAARFEDIPENGSESDGEDIEIKYSQGNKMMDSMRSYHTNNTKTVEGSLQKSQEFSTGKV